MSNLPPAVTADSSIYQECFYTDDHGRRVRQRTVVDGPLTGIAKFSGSARVEITTTQGVGTADINFDLDAPTVREAFLAYDGTAEYARRKFVDQVTKPKIVAASESDVAGLAEKLRRG